MDNQKWVPVMLPDGTRSDGKAETYDRCVRRSALQKFLLRRSMLKIETLSAYSNGGDQVAHGGIVAT
jgi:hypothetical protein